MSRIESIKRMFPTEEIDEHYYKQWKFAVDLNSTKRLSDDESFNHTEQYRAAVKLYELDKELKEITKRKGKEHVYFNVVDRNVGKMTGVVWSRIAQRETDSKEIWELESDKIVRNTKEVIEDIQSTIEWLKPQPRSYQSFRRNTNMKELWQIIKDAWREFEYKLALWIKKKFSKEIITYADYEEWYGIIELIHSSGHTTLLDKVDKLEELAEKFHSEEVYHVRIKENLPTLKMVYRFIREFEGEFKAKDAELIDDLIKQVENKLDESISFLNNLQEIRNEDLRNMARTFKEG